MQRFHLTTPTRIVLDLRGVLNCVWWTVTRIITYFVILSLMFCPDKIFLVYFVWNQATTVSPKPSFRAPWRVGDAVVGREFAGRTTSKNGHPCPCQKCWEGPPAEKTGRGSLLNRRSCSPDNPTERQTELNWRCWISRTSWSVASF